MNAITSKRIKNSQSGHLRRLAVKFALMKAPSLSLVPTGLFTVLLQHSFLIRFLQINTINAVYNTNFVYYCSFDAAPQSFKKLFSMFYGPRNLLFRLKSSSTLTQARRKVEGGVGWETLIRS